MTNLNPNASGSPGSGAARSRSGGYDPAVSDDLDRLAALVARLRRDCPWDREQSFDTLKTYLLEETYETLAALDAGDPDRLRDELGDLLFQVFFLARLSEERGGFGIDEVARGITREDDRAASARLRRTRRPESAEEVKSAWEKRKRRRARRPGGSPGEPSGGAAGARDRLSADPPRRGPRLRLGARRRRRRQDRGGARRVAGGREGRGLRRRGARDRRSAALGRQPRAPPEDRSRERSAPVQPALPGAVRGRRAPGARERAGRVGNADGAIWTRTGRKRREPSS